MLLDAGSNAEVQNQEGQTALMLAARAGSVEVAELLVRHGANVNAQEKWRGQTALMTNSAEVILRGIEKRRVLRPAPIAGLKARATSVTRSRTHFISPTPDS